jgi:hypothetical protein
VAEDDSATACGRTDRWQLDEEAGPQEKGTPGPTKEPEPKVKMDGPEKMEKPEKAGEGSEDESPRLIRGNPPKGGRPGANSVNS